jgi:hypothetical protein
VRAGGTVFGIGGAKIGDFWAESINVHKICPKTVDSTEKILYDEIIRGSLKRIA